MRCALCVHCSLNLSRRIVVGSWLFHRIALSNNICCFHCYFTLYSIKFSLSLSINFNCLIKLLFFVPYLTFAHIMLVLQIYGMIEYSIFTNYSTFLSGYLRAISFLSSKNGNKTGWPTIQPERA